MRQGNCNLYKNKKEVERRTYGEINQKTYIQWEALRKMNETED